MEDWYDYPAYFDLAFRDETKPEADFFEAAFARYATGPVRSVLEPACGSGRLVVEMAARGYAVTGFDLSEPMLAYARQRLARRKLSADLYVADMAKFKLPRSVDAAFNTFNSFRHLLSEKLALEHLKCMAKAIRPGGIYVLGLHLLPPDASDECTERWKAESGKTKLNATLKVVASNRRRRIERLQMTMNVRKAKNKIRIGSEFDLRTYSAQQIKSLIRKVPELEVRDVFDFWYEIDSPLPFTNEMSDTAIVLRRL